MVSCKKIVSILSSGQEISIFKKATLQLHLFLCKNCTNYKKHLDIININVKNIIQKRMQASEEEIEKIEKENLKK